MDRQRPPTAALIPNDGPTQLHGPSRDRDIVKMAELILARFPDVSKETAHLLLKSTSRRKR